MATNLGSLLLIAAGTSLGIFLCLLTFQADWHRPEFHVDLGDRDGVCRMSISHVCMIKPVNKNLSRDFSWECYVNNKVYSKTNGP